MNENVRNKNEDNIKKLQKLNNETSLGYANDFIVILTLLSIGIAISISLFLALQF